MRPLQSSLSLARCTAFVAAVMLLGSSLAWGRAQTIRPSQFLSDGPLISGWHWVRSPTVSATWTFDVKELTAAKPNSVYLNLSPLVTNGANGGSGFGMTVQLALVGPKPGKTRVTLVNPFRPTDPDNSAGLGYQTYGYASLPRAVWQGASQIQVVVTFDPKAKNHLAVNKDCLVIGYSR